MLTLLLLTGCLPDFPETRHTLGSFRLAAVTVAPQADHTRMEAWVWSGRGAWHAAPLSVAWEIDGVTYEGARIDAAPPAPFDFTVRVEGGDGEVEEGGGSVEASAAAPGIAAVTRAASALTVADADASVEDRADAEVLGDTPIAPDSAARLSLDLTGAHLPARWMASGGHLAELSDTEADWFASTVTLDDLVVEESAPSAVGLYHLWALVLDGHGAAQLATVDVAVDAAPPTSGLRLAVDGRLLPTDLPDMAAATASGLPASGWYSAALTTTDTSTGFTLTSLTEIAGPDGFTDPCTGASDSPLDLRAVAQGVCALSDLQGQTVALSGGLWGGAQ